MLNRLVVSYLDIAEINAISKRVMYMKDWVNEVDKLLLLTNKKVLKDNGKISHEKALKKAYDEYNKYNQDSYEELSKIEIDLKNMYHN